MKLTDLITPETPAGTALFLQWNGYHVFSIPQRELLQTADCVRFFGVGGKRQHSKESLIDCALRESIEEIGAVVSRLENAERTYFFKADGTIESVQLVDSDIRPRLILEKRHHSLYGSMANQTVPYYLVGFNASLSGKPKPSQEIAAIVYLKDMHLSLLQRLKSLTVADLLQQGAQLECQANCPIDDSTLLVPHGTARFLIQQLSKEC